MRFEKRPQLKPLCTLLLTAMAGWHAEGRAAQSDAGTSNTAEMVLAQVEFDGGLLHNGAGAIDVSRYARGNVVPAGSYRPDIYVNGQWAARLEVPFKAVSDTVDAQPCFDKALLATAGVDLTRLPEDVRTSLEQEGACVRLGEAIPDASASFDFNELRLNLSIPQISLLRRARGYVSADQWSAGVTAGKVGYNFNLYQSHVSGGPSSTQGYLGLETGVNIGRWHFRHNGSYTWDDRGQNRYQNIATYVQRDIADWSSQVVIGDSYTSGDLFDSTQFRGVRIYSDDRMLPESQRGYAPVVRGFANTNAKVTIKQNGMTLYETTVAPGAFVIDDLYPTGYGGDLQVAVTEADGRVHSFSVPYAAVPLALRPGQSRYSITAGVARDSRDSSNPPFAQATWQRGFTNTLTGYAGLSVSEGYLAGMVGGVLNSPWGAFGADVTRASTNIPGERRYSGSSFRVSYAKTIEPTDTSIALAAYRYSTSGHFSLNDAMLARDQAKQGLGSDSVSRQRNRASLTLSQRLGERGGSLSATASVSNYWNRSSSDINYSVGYSNTFRNLSYSVSVARQRDAYGQSSTLFYLSLSMPLGRTRPAMLSGNLARDTRGSTQVQTSLSGSLGVDNNVSYGLNVNHNSAAGNAQTNGGANITYRAPYAELAASVGASADYQQFSLGARGAVVAHRGGVTLSQPLSETFGIVEAPNAEGARITNASGVRVDRRGYAIVPYLTPFKMNDIELDPKGLSTDVELKETNQRVAPLAGAVPMLSFKTNYGRSAVIQVRLADGKPVPYGAVIRDDADKEIGVVGQASKAFVRGLQDKGNLTVTWGEGSASACRIAYELPAAQKTRNAAASHPTLNGVCEPKIVEARLKRRAGVRD